MREEERRTKDKTRNETWHGGGTAAGNWIQCGLGGAAAGKRILSPSREKLQWDLQVLAGRQFPQHPLQREPLTTPVGTCNVHVMYKHIKRLELALHGNI